MSILTEVQTGPTLTQVHANNNSILRECHFKCPKVLHNLWKSDGEKFRIISLENKAFFAEISVFLIRCLPKTKY